MHPPHFFKVVNKCTHTHDFIRLTSSHGENCLKQQTAKPDDSVMIWKLQQCTILVLVLLYYDESHNPLIVLVISLR